MLSVISILGLVFFSVFMVLGCVAAYFLIQTKKRFNALDQFTQEEFNALNSEGAGKYREAFSLLWSK